MKRQKNIIIITVLFILTSCSSNKNFINIENIHSVKSYKENSIVYALPKTVIVLDIQVTKITKRRGPFYAYTEEFLGKITNTITSNSDTWQISDVDFYTYPVVDTNQIFVINSKSSTIANRINLTPEGLLVSINTPAETVLNTEYNEKDLFILNDKKYKLSYGELSLEQSYKEVYDTIYRIEKNDTSEIKIPVVKKTLVKKSEREQAKELAEEILILRDDKNALLVGEADSDYLPEGDALKVMIQGIEKLEQLYLSMFIGKTYHNVYHYKFEFTPKESQPVMQEIMFRFSPELGILPKKSIKGSPIILELNSDESTSAMKTFSERQAIFKRIEKNKNKNTGIFYRIPEMVNLKLLYNKKTLAKKDALIAQYGTILSLPAEMFLNGNFGIEFYPNYGSIKRITE